MLSVNDTERAFENGKVAGRKELFDELLIEMAGMKYPTPEKGFDRVSDVAWHIEMGAKERGNLLRILQKELPKLWTDELYSEQFKNSPSKYKDFDHALKHVLKAAVMLQNMVEEADHHGSSEAFQKESVEKYVADLVICAVRLALSDPNGSFNLNEAVLERIHRKMGTRLA